LQSITALATLYKNTTAQEITMSETLKITGIALDNFNQRRNSRGADAAQFKIAYSDGTSELLWMSAKDIKANIKVFPEHKVELDKGLAGYGARA
jgi:hypothetical protein